MPVGSAVQSNFTAGEFSPRLFGRSDLSKYNNALETCQNMIVQKHGGAVRRSGMQHVAEVKTSTKKTRVVEFIFSVSQTYILEFGENYIRFYRDRARLEHGPIFTVIGATFSAGTATVTTSAPHSGLVVGDQISVQGIVTNNAFFTGGFNGLFTITALPFATVVEYAVADPNGTYVSGGTVVETTGTIPTEEATPYLEDDLALLKFTQSADQLFVVHPKHAPRVLSRIGAADSDPAIWRFPVFSHPDGPWLFFNADDDAKLLPDSDVLDATVNITADANAVALINDGLGFQSTDVGRLIALRIGGVNWGFATITVVTDDHTIVAKIDLAWSGTTPATSEWALGSWSDTTGFPRAISFHQDRLWFGGTDTQPQTVWGSQSSSFNNFKPFIFQGTMQDEVLANLGISRTILDNTVNTIQWLKSDSRGLVILTDGGAFLGGARDSFDPITPGNFIATRQLTDPTSDIAEAQQANAVILMVTSADRKILEFVFRFEDDKFVAPDLTILSEHITIGGIIDTAFQTQPDNILWCVRDDGALLGMTYERNEQVVAWHEHIAGGSRAGGRQAKVESVAVNRDGNDDLVWVVVRRTINGLPVRYVEFIQQPMDDEATLDDAFYVDSGLTLDDAKIITGATTADPVVITAVAHGFSNSDSVRIRDVIGMTEINDTTFTVANVTADTFELAGIDGTAFTTYVIGGNANEEVTTITGLDHLEAEIVQVLGDGKVQADKTVSGGSITITAASIVSVGLSFKSRLESVPLIPRPERGPDPTGKAMRIDHVIARLNRTTGLKIDTNGKTTGLDILLKNTEPLFTGTKKIAVSASYEIDQSVIFETEEPLPVNILAYVAEMAYAAL